MGYSSFAAKQGTVIAKTMIIARETDINFLNTIICLHYAITRKGFDENEHTVALIVDRLDRSIKILKHTWYPARISQNNI